MLDPVKVQRFWEGRAAAQGRVAFESIANLEQNAQNLQLKIATRPPRCSPGCRRCAAARARPRRRRRPVDVPIRRARRGARRRGRIRRGAGRHRPAEAARRGFDGVEFVVSAAEAFATDETFDLIFVSGLFVYLNDDQSERLLKQLPSMLKPGGTLLLRDGTGVGVRHEIDDRYSEHLAERYSATYRTRDQYVAAFAGAGLTCARDENMFAEGHPLNKYPETRLRLYQFR